MATSVRMINKELGVARDTVSAEAAKCWAELAEELVTESIALCINVGVQVVGIDNWAEAIKLLNHVVDTAGE